MNTVLQTEFPFTLPRGYIDNQGNLHREGIMRLATAGEEILPLKDPRVQTNPAYLVIIVLSRVITRLGSLSGVNPQVVEGLFAADLSYLQDFYNRINNTGTPLINVVCPRCDHKFEMEMTSAGEV